MNKQFENPQESKVEEKTVVKANPKKTIDTVAEKAAKKASKTEQSFDKDKSQLFSR
ncbi:MAG: hypothetical protein ABR907_02675 [Terracidiphilus sp.]|jgi:hypothetical protein